MYISGNKALVNHKISNEPIGLIPEEIKDAQRRYNEIRILEPLITLDLKKMAENLHTDFSGLEYSIKAGTSVTDKLIRRKADIDKYNSEHKDKTVAFSPEQEVLNLKDAIRYTEICEHDSIIEKANESIAELESKGYIYSGSKNYYQEPYKNTGYMGIHLNFISPYGQEIELQVHSQESFQAKQEGHALYEKIRAVGTPEKDKAALSEEIFKVHGRISKPRGYETFDTIKMNDKKKAKIMSERRKAVSFTIEQQRDEKVNSMVYTISMNSEPILYGFENTQSDGSMFFYRNNFKDLHFVASLTSDGIETGYHNAEKTTLSVDQTLQIAKEMEESHEKWMKEHFPNGELGEIDVEEVQRDFYQDSLDEVLSALKQDNITGTLDGCSKNTEPEL